MNTKLLICATLICLTSFSACKPDEEKQTGQTSEKKEEKQTQPPEAVAKEFLDAFFTKRDLPKAYQYLSASDKQAKTEAQYIQEKAQPGLDESLKNLSSFEIKKSEITANKATITADVKVLDTALLFKEAFGNKNLFEIAAMKKEDQNKHFEEQLAKYKNGKKPLPMTTLTETFDLIQENGEWKLSLGWAEKAKEKENQNPVLKVGEQGILMSNPEKGNVLLKVNGVKFKPAKTAGMAYCIVNVAISNQMKAQFTEAFVAPLSGAEIYASGGNKYARDLSFFSFEHNTKDVDILNPLNPGKTTAGDIAFQVDKTAKDLVLKFDAGHSPIPNNHDYSESKSLSFKLGDVAL